MESNFLTAPKIRTYIMRLKDGKLPADAASEKVADQIYEKLRLIEPDGDDGRRELWLKAKRGPIEDFGDFKEWLRDGDVSSYEEFESWWLSKYPDETIWFRMVSFERDDYRAMFLGRELIYQSPVPEWERYSYEIDVKDLFEWVLQAICSAIEEMRQGIYNEDVSQNLAVRHRTGVIRRKDYWDIEPECRENYMADISKEEVDEFVRLIAEQTGDKPVGEYQKSMTAGMFYEYCRIGYVANDYKLIDELTAKELYYKYADRRDEGLAEIDENSSEEFDQWYFNRNRHGGHPWEVCAGGNSTHVDLFVRHDDNGYFLQLGGKAWSRSIETIKFYIALRHNGVAVHLLEADGIKARLLEEDYIGIVPDGVIPVYCEGLFPGYKILDFMVLPYEKTDKVIEKTTWLKEEEQFLKTS